MISSVAVALALAFWAPYTPMDLSTGQHVPVCSNGVQVAFFTADDMTPVGPGFKVHGWAVTGYDFGCGINLRDDVPTLDVATQCGIIVHELGHARMNLPHSDDPTNVMWPGIVTPPGCNPESPTPEPKAVAQAAPRAKAAKLVIRKRGGWPTRWPYRRHLTTKGER